MVTYGYPYFFEIYKQNPCRVTQFYGVAVKLDLNKPLFICFVSNYPIQA